MGATVRRGAKRRGAKKRWGKLATIPRACRPATSIKFTVNNHVYPTKIKITPGGHVVFQSGSTKYGWISLSGVVWKSKGKIRKRSRGISRQIQGRLITANGWKGSGTSAYRQGKVCM